MESSEILNPSQLLHRKGIIILGMGLSGCSAARFIFTQQPRWVLGVDQKADQLRASSNLKDVLEKGLQLISEQHQDVSWDTCDLVVVSPGIPRTHPFLKEAQRRNIPVLGEIELAARFITRPCLGITGTNGKTTVTLLVEHVLNASDVPSRALGNVEVPLAEGLLDLKNPHERVVLELSSYQLETLESAILDAAVILNITPDHLDRYGSMEKYAAAKMKIASCLKKGAPLFIEEKAYQDFGFLLKGIPVQTYGYSAEATLRIHSDALASKAFPSISLPENLMGKKSHDGENFAAAWMLCSTWGISPQNFLAAYTTFKKPSHRLEFVAEQEGITFYDDSKGTNTDAVIRAVQSLKGPIVLIAGGVDKGAPYTPWIEAFGGKVKGICAIGEAAAKMKQELSSALPVKIFSSLQQATEYAAEWASEGEQVLLSPGCSSYDMFRDYKQRGEEFQRIVLQLRVNKKQLMQGINV